MMRRIRPRVSLRVLLLLMTALCLLLGFFFGSARRQERAVKAIEEVGGHVGYAHNFDFDAGHWIRGEPSGPIWLRDLFGRHFFDTVIDVRLSRGATTHSKDEYVRIAEHLTDLPQLHFLSLGNLGLADREMALLVTQANPEELICLGMEISDHLATELTATKKLKKLGLNDVIISAEGLASFKDFPRLESFWLSCKHESRSPTGEIVWGSEKYGIRDDAVSAFIEYPKLRRLSLSWTQISNDGVRVLSSLTQLESFEISSPQITDEAMSDIAELKHLTWLGLGGTNIGNESLSQLREFRDLKGLRLSSAVTNEGLPRVAELQQLEKLFLSGEEINDDGLVHLKAMKNLTTLDLQSTDITTDGPAVKELKRALPNCSIRQYYPSPSFRFTSLEASK